jgi:hypothetical protein
MVVSSSVGYWLGDISTGSMIAHCLHRLNRVRRAWRAIFLRRRHCQIVSAPQSPPSGPLPIMIWNGGKGSYFYSQGVQLHRGCVTHGQTAQRASPEMVALNE